MQPVKNSWTTAKVYFHSVHSDFCILLGNLLHMVEKHSKYTLFNPRCYYDADSGTGADDVRKRFVNRAFPGMYHCCVTESQSALTWLVPTMAAE